MRSVKNLFALPLCLFIFLVATPGWSASDTGSEIRRLVNEAPPLASFPNAGGMIWKQHTEYRMLADGSMEKTTRWFILSGKNLPEGWRTWTPTVGPEGNIEVLESGIFDPLSGRIVTPLLPRVVEGEGFNAVEIRSPELEEEQLLCLAFREIFPTRYNVDDFLWTAFDLPCWEQTVVVEVPAESDFSWEGRDVPEPSVQEEKGVRRYTWSVVNRAGMGQATVAIAQRPYLTFSLRTGIRSVLDDLGLISREARMPVPRSIGRHLRKDMAVKQVRRFLEAVDDPSRRMEDVPGWFVRSSGVLAGKDSWTAWERTLLAGTWLAESGVDVEVYWLPKVSIKKGSPASPMAWVGPVLEIKPKGGDAFFWAAGQKDAIGGACFSLSGKKLYRVQNGGFQARTAPSGKVEDHRLILTWDLSLDGTGAMEGTLKVDVRGGWIELVGESSRVLEALKPVVQMPDLSHFSTGKAEVRESGESVGFEIPVSFNAGIPSGSGALLLRLPSAVFPVLDVKNSSSADGLSLRFPFVVDQRYNIHLPEGYRLMAPPKLAGTESGAVRFSEELRERAKKGRLEGSFRMVVTERNLDAAQARAFIGISRRVAQWGALTIPLKK